MEKNIQRYLIQNLKLHDYRTSEISRKLFALTKAKMFKVKVKGVLLIIIYFIFFFHLQLTDCKFIFSRLCEIIHIFSVITGFVLAFSTQRRFIRTLWTRVTTAHNPCSGGHIWSVSCDLSVLHLYTRVSLSISGLIAFQLKISLCE
jgi:hypothetical protein